ncbi:hypothetical protein B0H67DRAFT_495573 [Lasiosphaeris hirsuta]|uniref:Uncharacterized protein n=1 Tax=Lasiosphaeris hirsuta TaxID=260670 RepID=A0AA40A3M5_9PEZI|nr:hypothetical protein B0H67DRAFT_495573 [Lasiosphaeris hirsuta]
MKLTIASAILTLVGLATATTATSPPIYPKTPSLTYLYTVNITGGDPVVVGPGPRGLRIIAPILHGTFSGPRFGTGKVLPIGADWELIDANNEPNGTLTVDVRQTFQLDDGAVIQVFESGSTQTDGTAHVRLTYETGSAKHYWVNSIVAVGIIHVLTDPPGSLTINAWQLTAPS